MRASRSEQPDQIASLVDRIEGAPGRMRIVVTLAPFLDTSASDEPPAAAIDGPLDVRQAGRAKPIVVRAGDAPRRNPDLIALVADARRWAAELLDGGANSVEEITRRDKLRPGNVSRLLPLAWLAPGIASAILEGRQPADLTAKRLRDLPDLPLGWSEQRQMLGFPRL